MISYVRLKIEPRLVITLSHCSKLNKISKSFQIKKVSLYSKILSIRPCSTGRVVDVRGGTVLSQT